MHQPIENRRNKVMGGTGVKHVQIRLSDTEHDALLEAAGDVPIQRYARNALLAATREPPEPILAGLSAADRALVTRVAELARSKSAAERIKIIRLVANMPMPEEID